MRFEKGLIGIVGDDEEMGEKNNSGRVGMV
jgi:hypothetical protein